MKDDEPSSGGRRGVLMHVMIQVSNVQTRRQEGFCRFNLNVLQTSNERITRTAFGLFQ